MGTNMQRLHENLLSSHAEELRKRRTSRIASTVKNTEQWAYEAGQLRQDVLVRRCVCAWRIQAVADAKTRTIQETRDTHATAVEAMQSMTLHKMYTIATSHAIRLIVAP